MKPILNTRHSVSRLSRSVLPSLAARGYHPPKLSFLLLLCILLSELLIPDEETDSNLHIEGLQLLQGGTTRATLPLQVSLLLLPCGIPECLSHVFFLAVCINEYQQYMHTCMQPPFTPRLLEGIDQQICEAWQLRLEP